MVVWMNEDPLVPGRTYFAKHTTRTVRATVRKIVYRVDIGTQEHGTADRLAMNEIAEVDFETNLPLFFDAYDANRITGSIILIDGLTNATVGAAMILGVSGVSIEDSARPVLVVVQGRPDLVGKIEKSFAARQEKVVVLEDAAIPEDAFPAIVRALQQGGVVAITSRSLSAPVLEEIRSVADDGLVFGEGLDVEEILRLAGVTV
jgi:hypothetical protein